MIEKNPTAHTEFNESFLKSLFLFFEYMAHYFFSLITVCLLYGCNYRTGKDECVKGAYIAS